MISSLRKKFILISVASIFVVFSVIFLLLLVFTRVQMDRTMDMLADVIVSNDGVFPEFDPARRPMAQFPYSDVITEETPFSTRFFTVWLDGEGRIIRSDVNAVSAVGEADVEEYARAAADSGRKRGWVADYRYCLADNGEGSTLVFVNGTMYQGTANRLLFTVFLVLLGSAVLILTLTVVLSKRVVRPVAESYEKQKQFITDANHELKTPLTLILSNLDIVESEVGQNEWLDDIRSEGERMGLLINQLVTLSRMDESDSRLQYADFDLSAALGDTVSEFQGLMEERGCALRTDIEPAVICHGDEAMLRRLAALLLDNAAKYCDRGGEIRVRLLRRRHPVLTVENTYAAADSLELDRLFDRFYRADRARTFSGSFGVGLSIAQSIVKSHQGSISAYRREQVIGFRVDLK